MIQKVWDFTKTILLPIFIVSFLMNYIFINAYVPTGSMEDTIMAGNRVFGIRLFQNYERGDIIVFPDPDGSGNYLIKRIIGLPGDVIEIRKQQGGQMDVVVNGGKLEEFYIKESMVSENELRIELPEDGYFVMGDNRNHSYDARYWDNKIVFKENITGIALFKFWPVTQAKLLR